VSWVPGRAWAALRYDERREVNKEKVHRLWREEGLQVKVVSPRKRAGVSSISAIEADAANVVWAIDLNRSHWNTLFEARVVIGDFKHEHNHRHRHSALGYRTPAEYAAACRHTHTPVACEIN
jgi:transposase InsO family protein